MGGDFLSLCLAIEELARVDQSIAVTLEAGVGLGSMLIFQTGSEEQKKKYLPALVSGEALAGFGLTEPDGGSDAGRLRTTAVLEGDEWVINGAKTFITNSGTSITSLVIVACITGTKADGTKELSTIIVPNGTPGFIVEPSYFKLGWHASDTHPLSFTNVRVPASNLLGERGRGYANFLNALDDGRIAIAALAVGAAQGCIDESVRYAKERKAFGKSIGEHQSIAFKIAEMQARTHVARLAYYHAASLKAAGKNFKTEASIAKLVASDAAMDNARAATQIFGGYGFMDEYSVARHYRDSKVLEIGEGTSEVQKMLIARSLGLNA
jgi:short/branched chain acyl-CoA dehydrogenase